MILKLVTERQHIFIVMGTCSVNMMSKGSLSVLSYIIILLLCTFIHHCLVTVEREILVGEYFRYFLITTFRLVFIFVFY